MAEPQVVQMVQVQPGLKQATGVPTRKVAVGGVTGAAVTIVVWVLNTFFMKETPIPDYIAAAATTALSFAASYYVPPASNDQPVPA